jgi:hypothetical protein
MLYHVMLHEHTVNHQKLQRKVQVVQKPEPKSSFAALLFWDKWTEEPNRQTLACSMGTL